MINDFLKLLEVWSRDKLAPQRVYAGAEGQCLFAGGREQARGPAVKQPAQHASLHAERGRGQGGPARANEAALTPRARSL